MDGFFNTLDDLTRRLWHRYLNLRSDISDKIMRYKVLPILSDLRDPVYLNGDNDFKRFKKRLNPRHNYNYDAYSVWERGSNRADFMMNVMPSLCIPGKRVLEAGCGDGMTGAVLSHFGHQVSLVDIEDWRDPRAKELDFFNIDMCKKIPFSNDTFDMIFSFNTFEHILNPEKALYNLINTCKTGGLIYLDFGPLYWSPWGLHAHRTINVPYLHLLFPIDFIKDKLAEIGINDLGQERNELQHVNKWTVRNYESLFEKCGCKIEEFKKIPNKNFLNIPQEFPQAFRGRGLTYEDITTQAFRVILRKVNI
jgi:SAM-dependent methyltransferase